VGEVGWVDGPSGAIRARIKVERDQFLVRGEKREQLILNGPEKEVSVRTSLRKQPCSTGSHRSTLVHRRTIWVKG